MIFFQSIRFKLIIFSVFIEVVMLGLLITNSSRLIETHLTAQASKQLEDMKNNFHASLLPLLVMRDYASLDSILKEYTTSNKISYIFIQKDGQIIASSNWDKRRPIPQLDQTFNTQSPIFNTKTTIESFGQNYGDVYFGIDTTFLQTAKKELVSQSILIALFEILLSIILLFTIGYFLTKNLSLLTEAAENISDNKFDIKLKIKTKDEMGLLAKTFNKMVVQITDQFRTIKEQNMVQQELIHSLDTEIHRVKAILENAGDAIHILDAQGNVFMFSDSFAHSIGYTNDEIKELNVQDWDQNFDLIELTNLMKNPKTFEAYHTRKDGTNFPVEIRTAGVQFDEKMYLYAASRDISERQLAQEQLRQKDILLYQQSKMASMGEMIGNIAHQWRQPLSLISTSVTGLSVKLELGLETSKNDMIHSLNNVNDTVQFLSRTIDDFQNYLKPNQASEEFNLKDVVLKNLEMFGKAFEINDIQIITNYEDIKIKNTQNELVQVVINILNNAKDALKEHPMKEKYIFINIYKDEDNGVISIKDNAGGIPIDILPKIFDAYFTTKGDTHGTGLGLYMSYQIITNRFAGIIEAKNEEFEHKGVIYKGANFKIIIPLG